MKIGILGYGKMGREVESAALDKGHEIVWKIDASNKDTLTPELLKKADIVIEFTTPHTAEENIKMVLKAGIPVVTGSTGWYENLDEITAFCHTQNGTLFYASNFSIGVNLFFEASRYLSELASNYAEYTVDIEEIHHTQKLDAPSGTAITLAQKVCSAHPHYTSWCMDTSPRPDEIPIRAIRTDAVPGTHTLTFQGPNDKLVFTHEAFNRKGFASGAVTAAEWIIGKKGVYNMDDLLNLKK